MLNLVIILVFLMLFLVNFHILVFLNVNLKDFLYFYEFEIKLLTIKCILYNNINILLIYIE